MEMGGCKCKDRGGRVGGLFPIKCFCLSEYQNPIESRSFWPSHHTHKKKKKKQYKKKNPNHLFKNTS